MINTKLILTLVASVALLLPACTFNSLNNDEEVINSSDDVPENVQVVPEPEPVVKRVHFTACGDNIIYAGNTRDAKSLAVKGGRTYNFKPMFQHVSDVIANADISFINQETLMAGEGYSISYYPCFNSPQDLGYDLVELGFDVVNIANNHMLDKGTGGLEATIKFWKGMEDVLMIGGYETPEDYDTVRILDKNGIKIAFLSYCEHTNGLSKNASSPIVIPDINDTDIVRQITLANEKADFVIVSVHWGDEGVFTPNEEQKRVAQLMADCKADLIIGHHPHVIQPVEWLTGKDGNKTLCVYSLGNFAAEQAYSYNMVGGIMELDIVSVDDGAPYIENAVFNPTVFHFPSNFYGNTVYLMKDYTPELANIHGVRTYYRNGLTYEGLLKYVKDTISEEFLPEEFFKEISGETNAA